MENNTNTEQKRDTGHRGGHSRPRAAFRGKSFSRRDTPIIKNTVRKTFKERINIKVLAV